MRADVLARDFGDQILVRQWVAPAEEAFCHLHVDQLLRQCSAEPLTETNLFAAPVHNDRCRVVRHQLPPAAQVGDSERIDQVGSLGRRQLDQAQLGAVITL